MLEENEAINAIERLGDMQTRHRKAIKELQRKFEEEAETAYRKRFPRRKYSLSRSVEENQPFHEEIYDEYGLMFKELIKAQNKKEADLNHEIGIVCENAVIPTTERLYKHYKSEAITYWSQGLGACSYAKASAQEFLDHAKDYGLKGEIRTVNSHFVKSSYPNMPGSWSADYEVWLNTTKLGFKILQNKKTSVLDWAIQCWRRGVNPKVYNPFLSDEIFNKSMAMR